MGTLNDLGKQIGTTFSKEGSWAILCLLLIGGLGYEAHVIIRDFGSRVTQYVTTSDRNLQSLLDAQAVNAQAHAILTTSISVLGVTLAENTKMQTSAASDIRRLKEIMEQSYEILKRTSIDKNSPALRELKQSIDGLTNRDGELPDRKIDGAGVPP